MRRTTWCLVVLLASACSRAPKPDLVLITVDTLRADHLGSYGFAKARTPYFDQLAREGVRFAECMSPVPITLPAHCSMLTGQLPHEHGVRNNLGYVLPDGAQTVTEELKRAGYQTAAFVSAFPLDARFGLEQGFDHYDDAMPKPAIPFEFAERAAPQTVEAAIRWLAQAKSNRPVFLWVHLFEPHAPYDPPTQLDGSYEHPYDGEITAADAAVRVLMAGVAEFRSKECITILTSDHGEGLGEHEEATHSFFLFESTLHVPLIVHAPQRWAPGVVAQPVSLCDIAPTLREFAGLKAKESFGQVLGASEMPARALYAESLYGFQNFGWSPVFARREGSRKFIRSARSRAYDLSRDPHEQQELSPDEADWLQAARGDLEARIREASAQQADATRGVSLQEQEALASLGYLSGGGQPESEDLLALMDSRPDGTDQHEEFLALTSAQNFVTERNYAEAVAQLKRVMALNARNGFAQSMLATAYDAMGELETAAAEFERAIALSPRQLETRINAGRVFYRSGKLDRAVENYRVALAIDPNQQNLWREAAPVFVRTGHTDELLALLAERIADSARAPAAEQAELHALYAVCAMEDGRAAEAIPHIARARELADSPKLRVVAAQAERMQQNWDGVLELLEPLPRELASDAEAQALVGLAHDELGRPALAVPYYRRALELDERLPIVHARLANYLLRHDDDPQGALPHAARAVELAETEASFHLFYVDLLERLGESTIAENHVRRFADRFPNDPIFAELKQRYGLP